MLPVMIYEPDEALRAGLLSGLDSLGGLGLPSTRISLSTASLETMQRAVQQATGIALAILGIPRGQGRRLTELGNQLMRQNRNSYTLFCLHDAGDLDELLAHCMRPAGILTLPLNEGRLKLSLRRILEDYSALTGESGGGDSLLIETGGATYRVDLSQILYLEALDKLLVIHTSRQNITVRRSLTAMAETLPESFVRCHRAYIVNREKIAQVQYAEMLLTLVNGETLPLSRGQRAQLKKILESGGGDER